MLTAAPWATTTAARTRAARLTATPSRRRAARRTTRAARAARRTAAKAWRKGSAPASGAQQSRVCCGSRLAEEILKTAAAQDEQHHDLRQPEGPGRGPRGIRSWLPLVRKTKPALKHVGLVVVSTVCCCGQGLRVHRPGVAVGKSLPRALAAPSSLAGAGALQCADVTITK